MTRYNIEVRNEQNGAVWTVYLSESCPQTAQEAALLLLFRDWNWSHATASVPVEEPW